MLLIRCDEFQDEIRVLTVDGQLELYSTWIFQIMSDVYKNIPGKENIQKWLYL